MKISSMVITGLMAFCVAGLAAAGTAAEAVKVTGAYARAVPPGQPNSASFLILTNGSDTDHRLVDAESPAAKVVELHTHINDNGMMKMRRVDGIDIPAGKETRLQPGGYHIMLIGLQRDLKPGEEIQLTLVFQDGSRTRVAAPVQKLQMKMMKQEGGTMKHDGKMMMK
jgi:copper(I)-binding protein